MLKLWQHTYGSSWHAKGTTKASFVSVCEVMATVSGMDDLKRKVLVQAALHPVHCALKPVSGWKCAWGLEAPAFPPLGFRQYCSAACYCPASAAQTKFNAYLRGNWRNVFSPLYWLVILSKISILGPHLEPMSSTDIKNGAVMPPPTPPSHLCSPSEDTVKGAEGILKYLLCQRALAAIQDLLTAASYCGTVQATHLSIFESGLGYSRLECVHKV